MLWHPFFDRPRILNTKRQSRALNNTSIVVLMYGFQTVTAWLLIACGTTFYSTAFIYQLISCVLNKILITHVAPNIAFLSSNYLALLVIKLRFISRFIVQEPYKAMLTIIIYSVMVHVRIQREGGDRGSAPPPPIS